MNPGKVTRIDRIVEEEHGREVSVVGIIKRIKNKELYLSKRTKMTATLCDPIRKHEIDFVLFLGVLEEEIEVGMVVVLHNFQVCKQGKIRRLNSTYRCYYYREEAHDEPGDIIREF